MFAWFKHYLFNKFMTKLTSDNRDWKASHDLCKSALSAQFGYNHDDISTFYKSI